MNLIEELLQQKSCSVVGLEKNTGKTVTLNYLLRHLPRGHKVAVTSIGLDGETQDQVTGTHKPEIVLYPGMLFATSEKHYRLRQLRSEVMDVSEESTALGRLVTGRVLTEGKVMLSGFGSTAALKRWMQQAEQWSDLIIVDGALSRMSLASPTISESMVLATGAAYSANIDTLVRKTQYLVELINLPQYNGTAEDEVVEVMGAVTNRVLEQIMNNPKDQGKELVIQDFTKVFADEMLWHRFVRTHKVSARHRSKLLGITVNPTAPNGMVLDSEILCQRMQEAVGVEVVDVMRMETEKK